MMHDWRPLAALKDSDFSSMVSLGLGATALVLVVAWSIGGAVAAFIVGVLVTVVAAVGGRSQGWVVPDFPEPDVESSSGAVRMPPGLEYAAKNAQGFEEYLHVKSGVTLILIPGGTFTMGSADSDADGDEQPLTEVTLSPFYLAKDEVTWGHYRRFCEATERSMPDAPSWGIQDDHPLVNVSWEDAKAYCDWAGLSLPTEAQWEYAARGSEGRKWPWGDEIPTSKSGHAQMQGMERKTAPVGSFPLGVGLFGHRDLAGNVLEWCADRWWNEHPGGRVRDPEVPDTGRFRVRRGGSWVNSARYLRGSYRYRYLPSERHGNLGFRPSLLTP